MSSQDENYADPGNINNQNSEGTPPNSSGNPDIIFELNYSGKAFRLTWIITWVVTMLLLTAAVYLTFIGKQCAGHVDIAWISTAVSIALLWLFFGVVYFYKTMTIKYRLTTHSIDTREGFFTARWDTMELINIEDLAVEVTLWDRIFNGGVGTITLFSKTDKTDPNGIKLKGIENPDENFNTLKKTRDKIRTKRALIS
ncbi:MAG: PH domain-containing protein [Planctomycetaceae bacterium]|nr:PH domain-containing protein [Planctomycetaceae bacterium]